MKSKTSFWRILKNACCIFTVIVFSLYLCITLVFGRSDFTTSLVNTAALFALSLAASSSVLIYERTKLPFWAAHIIVFIALGILYYLIVVMIPRLHKDSGKAAVAVGIYLVAFLTATVVMLCKRSRRAKAAEKAKEKDYKPKF